MPKKYDSAQHPRTRTGPDPYIQKILNATQKAFADRALLHHQNEELIEQNNEKRTRQGKKARKIGEAKIMVYEDIVEAQKNRHRKEASKVCKKGRKGKKGGSPSLAAKKERSILKETKAADQEIAAAGLSGFCSVLRFS